MTVDELKKFLDTIPGDAKVKVIDDDYDSFDVKLSFVDADEGPLGNVWYSKSKNSLHFGDIS